MSDFVTELRRYNITTAEIVKTPNVVSCEMWGARQPKAELTGIDIVGVVWHHMANANRPPAQNSVKAMDIGILMCRDCQAAHMDSNYLAPGGASDTGQHFTITVDGLIFEGRRGSRKALLDKTAKFPRGAQCENFNSQSIGIEHEGLYTDRIPPRALLLASLQLTAQICYTRKLDTSSSVYGHRQKSATACPGDAYYSLFPMLRQMLHQAVFALQQRKKP